MVLTITTNTLSDWYVEPEHATLISTISSLASEGLTKSRYIVKTMSIVNKDGGTA